jgi:tetratricopeptide (TPR) repeat protein
VGWWKRLLTWRALGAGAAVALLALLLLGSPVEMDGRFFHLSGPGLAGLARYLLGDYTGAARAYREDLRRAARSGERAAADPALAALLKGDLDGAGALARAVAARDPTALPARLTLAEVALQRGQPDAALAALGDEGGRPVEHFDALLLAAVAHARSGRPGPAIDLLNRALRSGYVEERLTSFLQALEVTGELERQPAAVRPVCLLSHLHRYLRIFDSTETRPAIRRAKQAIARGDRPADAHLTLGVVYDKQGYPEDALAEFSRAVELDPGHAEALRWSAVLHRRRGDLAQEYLAIKRAWEAAPDDPYYLSHFGDLLVDRLGDIHQAKTVWERAVHERPRDARALARLGEVEAFLGNEAGAVAHLEAALRLDPTNVRTQWQLGDALRRAGRQQDAITLLRRSVEAAPDSAWTHANLGMAYSGAGQPREAIRELEAAFRLGLDRVDYYQFLCELYFYEQTIALERAAECFRRVLAWDPRNARALRLLPEVEKNLRLGGRRP